MGRGGGEGWRGGRVVIPLVERDLSTIKILPSCYNEYIPQAKKSFCRVDSNLFNIAEKKPSYLLLTPKLCSSTRLKREKDVCCPAS